MLVAAVQQCGIPQPVDPVSITGLGLAKVKAGCEVFVVNATRHLRNARAANMARIADLIGATSSLNATASASVVAKRCVSRLRLSFIRPLTFCTTTALSRSGLPG